MTKSLYINRLRNRSLQICLPKKLIVGLCIFFVQCLLLLYPDETQIFYCESDFWKYIKSTRVLLVYLPKWNGYDKADVTDTNWTNAAMLQIISSVFPSCTHNKRIFSINLDSIKIYVNSQNLIKRNIKIDQYVYICLFCKQFLVENSWDDLRIFKCVINILIRWRFYN